MDVTRRFLASQFSWFRSHKADQEIEQEKPIDVRSTAAYWRQKHHGEPIPSKEILTTRLLVSAERVELVTEAGGRVLYPSVRVLFDMSDDADECGYPEHHEVAVVEVTSDSDSFAGLDILACSYRWENEKPRQCNDREAVLPANRCGWFAEIVCSRPVLLWLDYIASDFGRVVQDVFPKMGLIYSRFPVVPYYLLDPTLTLESMSRGWIFQETAFTCLDMEVMNAYVSAMDEAVAWMFRDADLPGWARSHECVAMALEGFFAFFERRHNSWLEPSIISHSTLVELVRDGVWHEEKTKYVASTAFPDDENQMMRFLRILRDEKRQAQILNLDSRSHYNKAGLVLAAFAQLDFSYEEDCLIGSLAQIAKAFFGEILSPQDVHAAQGLLKLLWEVRMDANTFHFITGVKRTLPGTATIGLGPLHLPLVAGSEAIDRMISGESHQLHDYISLASTFIAASEAVVRIQEGERCAYGGFSTVIIPGDNEPKRFKQYLGTTEYSESVKLAIIVFGDPTTGRVFHLNVLCRRQQAPGFCSECTVPQLDSFEFD